MDEQCGKTGAIWWRVSTDDQREISPDTQVRDALDLAEKEGFHISQEHILGTDWHSLSVRESPAMERLKELIRSRAIQAIFMHDADRGPSKPAHRLLLRAMCEEYGVRVRCLYGQVPEGDMGEVMSSSRPGPKRSRCSAPSRVPEMGFEIESDLEASRRPLTLHMGTGGMGASSNPSTVPIQLSGVSGRWP